MNLSFLWRLSAVEISVLKGSGGKDVDSFIAGHIEQMIVAAYDQMTGGGQCTGDELVVVRICAYRLDESGSVLSLALLWLDRSTLAEMFPWTTGRLKATGM